MPDAKQEVVKRKNPRIKYPCGCLIHVNGPEEPRGLLNICRHYCKIHAKVMTAMKELETSNHA